jgi:hypothetical protein
VDKDNLKERPIQRLLRHKHSMEYLSWNGWTKNAEEARTFQNSLEAARACAENALWEVEMVLRVKGGNEDLYRAKVR